MRRQRGHQLPAVAPPGSAGHEELKQVRVPDYSERLLRALELKGLLPDLVDPVYQLGFTAEDFTRPEFAWLKREALGTIGANVVATAAQQGFVQVLNLQAGKITVIERLVIYCPALVQIYLGTAPAAGTVVGPIRRDDRAGSTGSFTTSLVYGTSAAPAGAPAAPGHQFLPNGFQEIPGPFVITGIDTLVVLCSAVNTQLSVWCTFRERQQQQTER